MTRLLIKESEVKKAMKKAIAYLRVSDVSQIKGDGFPRQLTAIKRYAKKNGFTIEDEYRDDVSGTKDSSNRPGLAALLDRLEHNGVKVVLVERPDRLARDLMVSEIILAQFRKLHVKVIEAEGGNDLTVSDGDPTRTLIRQVMEAFSQFEKCCLVLKLKAARDRIAAKTGVRPEGRKAYGDRPGEQRVVEKIKKLRRKKPLTKRMSYEKIAAQLNEDGDDTRYGRPWGWTTVKSICVLSSS